MRPAFLVGLDFEAAILQRAGTGALVAIARQGDAAVTRHSLEQLIAQGADAVTSFGIAGALDPALRPGTLVLAEAVIDQVAGGAVIATDAAWRRAIALKTDVIGGHLVTVAVPVATPGDKAALFRQTGAIAVDAESAIAGRVAAGRGLPFLVVRAIADDARQRLPAAALAGVDADGNVRPWAAAAALLRRPGDIAALIRLGRATALARRALGAVAPVLVASG